MLRGERVVTLEVSLGAVVEVGPTPDGFRRVIPIVGGVVSQGIDCVVLTGGADWNVVRPDGSTLLWARYSLRLHDGAVVSLTNTAELAPGDEPPFLTSPTFEVGDEGPVWLRSGVFVGVLRPEPGGDAVHIDVHRVALVESA